MMLIAKKPEAILKGETFRELLFVFDTGYIRLLLNS